MSVSMRSVIFSNQEEADAQRRNLAHVRVCTQVTKHVTAPNSPLFSLKETLGTGRPEVGALPNLCRAAVKESAQGHLH